MIRVNWCPFVVKKSKNNVDTFSRVQVKTVFHTWNRGKLTIREKKNCVDTLPSVSTKTSNQPKLPSDEKEIRFPIRACPP
jgi:hypothetical protein